jgi:thiamine biosynthesis lipoprotein
MGTVVTFDFASLHPQLDAQLAQAQDALRTADEVFSLWKPQSPMSQVRRGDLDLLDAPLLISEVLDYCTVAKEMSGGWFDPWALPNGLDPTGFVKGWAAEVAAGYFIDLDLTGVIVNAAGDIVASGTTAEGEPLLAGILSAADPNRLIASVRLEHALATSGGYARSQHLFNTKAGHFGARAASASVVGPNLGLADAFATAVVCGGRDAYDVIAALGDYEVFVQYYDGSTDATSDFPFVEA